MSTVTMSLAEYATLSTDELYKAGLLSPDEYASACELRQPAEDTTESAPRVHVPG